MLKTAPRLQFWSLKKKIYFLFDIGSPHPPPPTHKTNAERHCLVVTGLRK